MARTIVVSRGGVDSTFDFKKLDRKQLYGAKRRIVLDPAGNPCTRADLTDDGSMLIRLGMTAQGYFDADTGAWIPSADLVGLGSDGQPVDPVPSTLGVAQPLEGPVSPAEVLDLSLKSVYMLDPTDVDAGLMEALAAGEVYRFPFAYRTDYNQDEAYILTNTDGDAFVLVGRTAHPQWCELEALPSESFEDDEEEDDLDFDFF